MYPGQIMEDNSTSTLDISPTNNGLSENEKFLSFCIDGVVSIPLTAIGITLNCVALLILLFKQNMQNMFNHLLVISFIFHNCYLFASTFPRLYYNFGAEFAVYAMPYMAYPLQEISHTASILMTICLSHERYAVIPNPRQYGKTMAITKNRRRRLLMYMLPVIVFAIGYNIPKFFSYELLYSPINKVEMVKTELRKSKDFIVYYLGVSWFTFVLISFIMIYFLNWKVVKNIQQKFRISRSFSTSRRLSIRDQISNGKRYSMVRIRKHSATNQRNTKKEVLGRREKMSLASIAIVVVFLFCNTLKVIDEIMDAFGHDDFKLEVASRLFLTINSALNIIIYCSLNRRFNEHFTRAIKYCIYLVTFTYFCRLESKESHLQSSETRSKGSTPNRH